jgi:hypothetical protein
MIKQTLQDAIETILSETTSAGQPISAATKATELADAIDAYIRTATVNGTIVSATTTCGFGPGTVVSGTITGTLS